MSSPVTVHRTGRGFSGQEGRGNANVGVCVLEATPDRAEGGSSLKHVMQPQGRSHLRGLPLEECPCPQPREVVANEEQGQG